jgi:hypothetical protein
MPKFRKKPVVIEAVQLCWKNWNAVCELVEGTEAMAGGARSVETYSDKCGEPGPDYIEVTIHTLEGDMVAKHGDYIIKGVKGEIYPCKPDIFEATYYLEETGG